MKCCRLFYLDLQFLQAFLVGLTLTPGLEYLDVSSHFLSISTQLLVVGSFCSLFRLFLLVFEVSIQFLAAFVESSVFHSTITVQPH